MKSIRNYVTKAKTDYMFARCGVMPEKEEGDQLIEVLGLILVGVVIMLLFKTFVVGDGKSLTDAGGVFGKAFGKIKAAIDSLFGGI